MISIYDPSIEKYSVSAIQAIQSGWISNHGEFIHKSTSLLENILGVKHAILMSNGTCATHCLFLSIQHKYPSIHTIYVPNNCYVAAYNAALMVYNIDQLRVMKMNSSTWNIETDESYIRSLEPNSAVLIVHNLGNIIHVPRLKKIRPDLIFVEDNCEGCFGKYDDVYSGTSKATLCSSISFYGNKMVTSGEGGAFLTNDTELYEHVRKVYSQGMSSIRYLHEVHAYNYRMTNIQAAFLYDQLSDLSSILQNKRKVFHQYRELLDPLIHSRKITLFEEEKNTESADWIFSVRIMDLPKTIENSTKFFKENGVDIRQFFYPINAHSHLASIQSHSNKLNDEVIMIPSSPDITLDQQKKVVDTLILFLDTLQ